MVVWWDDVMLCHGILWFRGRPLSYHGMEVCGVVIRWYGGMVVRWYDNMLYYVMLCFRGRPLFDRGIAVWWYGDMVVWWHGGVMV